MMNDKLGMMNALNLKNKIMKNDIKGLNEVALNIEAPQPPKGGDESALNIVLDLVLKFAFKAHFKIIFKTISKIPSKIECQVAGTFVSPFRRLGGFNLECKYILILLTCTFANTMLAQNDLTTLSLNEFLTLAKNNSISSDIAKLDKTQADLNYTIFKAGLKPQLAGTVNFPNYANTFTEVSQPDGSISFPRINNNNSSIGLQFSQAVVKTGGTLFARSDLQRFDDFSSGAAEKVFYNGTPFRVGFYQPLFGFNALKWDKKIEPLKLEEAKKKYSADMEAINLEAAELFSNLLIAYENLNIATSNKESNETLYGIAEEKFDLGQISKRDLLQLDFELRSANKNKKQAERSVRSASSAIYIFLGKKYNNEMIEPVLPEVTSQIAMDLTKVLQEGLTNRFELSSYARMMAEAERDIAQAKGEGGLQADLTASLGFSRSALNVGDIYSDPQTQQFVALQLSVPILDWGRQKSLVKLSEGQRDLLQKSIQQNKLQLEAGIQQTVDEFKNLQEQLQLNSEMKQLAQERFDITKQSFVLGAINLTELTLAQREKDQAAREYLFTLTQYWRNYFALRAMTLYDFENGKVISNQ